MEKICRICLQCKNKDFFYKSKNIKDGFDSRCIECYLRISREKYANSNKERKHQVSKKWREENKDIQKEKRKEYYEVIRETIKNIPEEKKCSKCKITKYSLFFDKNRSNRDGLCTWCKDCRNDYNRNRIENDPIYRLRRNVSRAILLGLEKMGAKKTNPTWSKLPYTPKELKEYIEKFFDEWMTWENHGVLWHIDHIISQALLPYSSMDDENFRKCWALENLRPLYATENMSLGGKLKNQLYCI